jgi:hypothetical protein
MKALSSQRGETGSIPLVLLAAIILAGLVVVLSGQVRTSQVAARGDRDAGQAIQIADAGVQAAFTSLANLASADEDDLPGLGESLTMQETGANGELEPGSFDWTARRVGQYRWEVRSTGSAGDRERYVEATIGPRMLFETAMFGDLEVGTNGASPGGGGAGRPSWHTGYRFVTYHPDTGTDPDHTLRFGSNHKCSISGVDTDEWETVGFGPGPHDGCDGAQGVEKLSFPDLGAEAFESGGVCHGRDDTMPNEFERGEVYCFKTLNFTPGQYDLVGSGDGPAEIYLEGDISIGGNGQNSIARVNVDPDVGPPTASDLVIYAAGGGEFSTGANFAHVAAGIYAPNRSCNFGAQTLIYGAVTCNDVSTKGGFNFWYDATMSDLWMDEEFEITSWREETRSSTSFSTD